MSMKRELHQTLFELLGSLYQAAAGTPVSVESVEIEAPVTMSWRWSGEELHLLASPAETAYRTGVESVVHPMRVTAVSADSADWQPLESETGNARPD